MSRGAPMARTPSVRGAREARTPGDLVPPGHERHTTFSPHPTPGLKKPKNVSTTDEIRPDIHRPDRTPGSRSWGVGLAHWVYAWGVWPGVGGRWGYGNTPAWCWWGCCGVRGVLRSHALAGAVLSALEGLTTGFGMLPGVPLPLWPRKNRKTCGGFGGCWVSANNQSGVWCVVWSLVPVS